MGSGRFDSNAYAGYTSSTANFTRAERFSSRGMKTELNPHGVKIRESRDSADNPCSNAIIVALDVTGSMGMIAEAIAKSGLGTLFNELFDKKPIVDPHVMFMGVGDVMHDQAPLQVSQFEADNRVVEQLTGLYLEGGGGGNSSESYHLPWYFAAMHTSIDCFEKRGKKGYLFTVGDEETPPPLTSAHVLKVMGATAEQDFTAEKLLELASRTYNVYHIIIEQGSHARSHPAEVRNAWQKLLGERALSLKDYTKLSEGIVSIIQRNEAELGNGPVTTRPKELPGYIALLA